MGNVHGVDRPSRLLSAATAFVLSLLFIAIYGLTGWFTSLRGEVGTWAFDWERSLPFVPWLIVPYMSLDMLFVVAPFLCDDRAELTAFRRRMTAAILSAGAMFLVVPLRFAFSTPMPDDWTRPIFELLHGFDRPFNLFPSLHIAISMILFGTYHRHTGGIIRWLIFGWFALIAASTVLTYQHHVIDVVGGLVLGICCYYLIPERFTRQPVTTNMAVGCCYFTASVVLAIVASFMGPWGWALFWPACSTAVVGGAYFGLYAGITRKAGGRLPLATTIVLAPWLVAQQLSLMYYRRHAAAWSVVAPDVWIGRQLGEHEAIDAVSCGVKAVLDLTGEFSEARAFRALPYLNLPILDLTAPARDELRTAVAFINAHRNEGVVYVHCKIGYSRSAAVVGAWLLDSGLATTAEESVARLRAVRPGIVVRSEAHRALRDYHRHDRAVSAPQASLIEVRT